MQTPDYDSEFCGNLPIHLTNLIQPYGALLVFENVSGKIIQASENTTDVIGQPVDKVVGSRIQDYLLPEDFERMQEKFATNIEAKIPMVWSLKNSRLLVTLHKKQDYMIAEIDLQPITAAEQESFIDIHQELKFVMARIEATESIQAASEIAAVELKRMSGFDKVMVYRFDEQWNGTVVAEAKVPEMESYYGVTFPASDVPKQARALYQRNAYRFIPDRTYTPVKLYPVLNPVTHAFIDLSDCNLRSVAAVHLEYLMNMRVTASMSTRIMKGDRLWGLIACHHQTAKYLNYEKRSIFELLSSIISAKVSSLENQEQYQFENRMNDTYSQLVEEIYRTGKIEDPLLSAEGVVKAFSGTGAVLSRNGSLYSTGLVPSADHLDDLILWLHTQQFRRVFHTDRLSQHYEEAKAYQGEASGLLVIPINVSRDEYCLIFRKQIERTVNWGGNPEERIQFEKDEKTYHPRSSFKLWKQRVVGTSEKWREEEIKTAEALRSFIYEFENTPAN